MHIGIDYTAAVHQGGGIGRYVRNLIRAVSALDQDTEYRLLVAGGARDGDGMGPWPRNFRVCPVPVSDRWLNILWQRLRIPLPVQMLAGPLDLFHSPDFVLPPLGKTPAILTVHDLSFMRMPQFYLPRFRQYLQGAVSRAVRKAQHILADSESSRRDLVELLGVDRNRVSVVYPGVESRFCLIDDAEVLAAVRTRYDLPDHFVLGLGTLQPRKNFEGLISAFARLLAGEGAEPQFAPLHLVIVGTSGWMYEGIFRQVEELGLAARVHFPGFVADHDLPALYNLAKVLAFPSWYEGFGLPVLEAMACGTPVVTANNSSLPEVVGQDGLLVDAADADALAHALHRLLCDDNLYVQLAIAGQERARRFNWQDAATEVLSLYRRLVRSYDRA